MAVGLTALLAWAVVNPGSTIPVAAGPGGSSNLALDYSNFEVQFKEYGLPAGATWAVTLNGVTESGSSVKLTFRVPNGTYSYTPSAVDYLATPPQGQVTMAGGYVQVGVHFHDPAPDQYIQHVVVIMMENSNLSRILHGGPTETYQNYLYHTFGRLPDYYALCHASPQNYITLVSGHTEACQGNATNSHVFNLSNLPDDVESHGLSWAGYFESMPTACDVGRNHIYDGWEHNPFLDLSDVVHNSSRCAAHVVNSAAFNDSVVNGTLPSFSLYVPNQLDDCHNSSQGFCDAWLDRFLSPILNSTAPAESALVQHTAFFVVYDEGDYLASDAGFNVSGVYPTGYCHHQYGVNMTACGGNTYAVAISPYSFGTSDASNTTDLDLTSTFEWLLGLPGVGGGYDGTPYFPPMASLFDFP